MTPQTDGPEQMLATAVDALRSKDSAAHEALDALPAAIYVTDADGRVTYFNRACIGFAGRTPVTGQDRWCVTWRLHTEGGAYLPHDRCPMAVAIREKKRLRGLVAVAERPDGTRVLFTPYPTPILDGAGELVGAVNILIDVTDRRQAGALKAQAQRCRRLSQSVTDSRTIETLKLMAAEYEQQARGLSAN